MSETILAAYISQGELAKQLNKSQRTLQNWELRQMGPPITRIGGTPYYQVDAVKKWLHSREQCASEAALASWP